MRADSVAWERAAEVNEAAEGWRRVGAIDEATERAIREAYPDPCITPSAVWRVLTACVVGAIIVCALGAFAAAFRPNTAGYQVLLFLFAVACFAVTEMLEASPRFARRGAAGATSFLGLVCLLIGLGLFFLETVNMRLDYGLDALLIAAVVVWGVGAWRWGSPVLAALSAVSLFLLLGRATHGRLLWVLAGAALTLSPPADWTRRLGRRPIGARLRSSSSQGWPPSTLPSTFTRSTGTSWKIWGGSSGFAKCRVTVSSCLRSWRRPYCLRPYLRGDYGRDGPSSSTPESCSPRSRSSPCGTTSISRRSGWS